MKIEVNFIHEMLQANAIKYELKAEGMNILQHT